MIDISKKDWEKFRERLPVWQERYMDRILLEYIQILSGKEAASDRFWSLDERIKRDRRSPGVRLTISRSSIFDALIRLLNDEVITMEDLSDFSDELKARISRFQQ